MCGIVGYLGHRQATEVLVEGLSKLEYRGYDSAGVAVNTGNELEIRKFKGRLAILAKDLEKSQFFGLCVLPCGPEHFCKAPRCLPYNLQCQPPDGPHPSPADPPRK